MEDQTRPNPKEQLTAAQAGRIIGVTRQGINELILRGRLPARVVEFEGIRFYVIVREDLDRYVANRRNAWGRLPKDYVPSVELAGGPVG